MKIKYLVFGLILLAGFAFALPCAQTEYPIGIVSSVQVRTFYDNGTLAAISACNFDSQFPNGTTQYPYAVMSCDFTGTCSTNIKPVIAGFHFSTVNCSLLGYGQAQDVSYTAVQDCSTDTLVAINNTLAVVNNSINSISNSSTSASNKLYIYSQLPAVVYKTNKVNFTYSFSNSTSLLQDLTSLNISVYTQNGTLFASEQTINTVLSNGVYNYSFTINSIDNGIWSVVVRANKGSQFAISTGNFRLASSGPYDFSLINPQVTASNQVTYTVNITNFGESSNADGTLTTWLSSSSSCAPILGGTYLSEMVLQPNEQSTALLVRTKTLAFSENTNYFICADWLYDVNVAQAHATTSFVYTVADDINPIYDTLPTPTPTSVIDYVQASLTGENQKYVYIFLLGAFAVFFLFTRRKKEKERVKIDDTIVKVE